MAILWNFLAQGSQIMKLTNIDKLGVLYKLLYEFFPSFSLGKNDKYGFLTNTRMFHTIYQWK